MTARTAYNPNTGERLQLVGGAWKPMGGADGRAGANASPSPANALSGQPRTAYNPQTGERLHMVGGQWQAMGPQTAQNGPQGAFGSSGGPDTSPAYGSPEWKAQRESLMGDMQAAQADGARAQRTIDTLRPVGRLLTGASRFANGATLGVPDRIVGEGISAIRGERSGMDTVRAGKAQMREEYPVTAYGGEIAGAVAGLGKVGAAGALPSQVAARAPGVAGMTGNTARMAGYGLDGAMIAGAEAAIGGRDPLKAAAIGGALGPVVGKLGESAVGAVAPIASRVGGAVDDGMQALLRHTGLDNALARQAGRNIPDGFRPAAIPSARPQARGNTPTARDLKQRARGIYNEVDDTGAALSPDATARLRTTLAEKLNDSRVGFNPKVHRTAAQVMRELDNAGDALSVKALRQLEARAKRVTGQGKFGGEDAHAAGIVRDHFRDALRNSPDLVPGAGQGPVAGRELSDKLGNADAMWRRAKTAESIQSAVDDALTGARVSGSGGNADNKIRQAMRKLATGRDAKYLDADTVARLKAISEGNPVRNAGRWMGKTFDPTVGGLMGNLNAAGALATGGGSIPLQAAGFAARRMSTRATKREALDLALQQLRGGPARPAQLPGVPQGAYPAPVLPIAGNMTPAAMPASPYMMANGDLEPWEIAELQRMRSPAMMGAR